MHVHQQQSQTCRPGEPLALREVKHPHKGRTSVSRSPSTEQEVLSQFSSYSEEIGHFTRDPCKPHLKSGLQSTIHASQKQKIPLQVSTENVNTHWVHSSRMEHAEHFPAPMEMCMDNHHTQTTERTQQQHLHDIGHAEFPPGMESTPVFPGNQFQQRNEEIMDTSTFTLGNTTLNRHSMLSTLTHPRRVPQNFQQLEMESSNTVALPYFNHNAEATTHMETPKNVHDKETLSNNLKMDTNMDANMDTNHMAHQYRHTVKEAHLLSEPSELQPLKAMAHQYTGKEAHLLSEPSELQPLKAMTHRYRHTGKEAHLLPGPSELQPPENSEVQKFNTSLATKTRIQPIHRNRKS